MLSLLLSMTLFVNIVNLLKIFNLFIIFPLRSFLSPLSTFPLMLFAGCTTVMVMIGGSSTNIALITSRVVVRCHI